MPGLVDEVDGRYGCPRCGMPLLNDAGIDLTGDVDALLTAKAAEAETSATTEAAVAAAEQPVFEPVRPAQPEPSRVTTLRWDAANWELNEKLRHIERVTTTARRRFDAAPPQGIPSPNAAWNAPQSPSPQAPVYPPTYGPPYAIAPWQGAYAAPPHPSNPYAVPPYQAPWEQNSPDDDEPAYYEQNAGVGGAGRMLASLVSWLFLGGAVTAFSCGGFLAAWGGLNGRPAVQQLGMPVVLLGMFSLVIGLLPQIFLRRLEERDGERIAVERPSPAKRTRGRQISRAPSSTGR